MQFYHVFLVVCEIYYMQFYYVFLEEIVSFDESVLFHALLYNALSSRYVGDLLYTILLCVFIRGCFF